MKIRKGIVYTLVMVSLFLLVGQNAFADTTIKRLAGQDRYETAVAVSQDGWTKSENLVLASGENFPDAICATPLARAYDAPILLISKTALTNGVWSEIKRMGVKNVFLIGGTGVIGENVEADLKAKGITVTRFGGKDRYDTAVKVAQAVEKTGKVDKVAVVQGRDYAGAVSIASIAAANKMPIILSDKEAMDSVVSQYFKGKTIAKSYIVGGADLLSSAIEKSAPNALRLAGKDKYEVNLSILKEFEKQYKYDDLYITTGENYPDALAASASAVKTNASVLLANKTLIKEMENFAKEKTTAKSQIKLIGGEAVLPTAVAENIIKKEEPPKVVDPPIVPETPKNPDPVEDPNKKDFVVCLDAGDGISKQENVGNGGVREKDVNLAVTLKIGKIIEESGIKVMYTRSADFVPWELENDLPSRFKISNEGKADFFISIHCNSFTEEDKKGSETYYLDASNSGKKMATAIQNNLGSVAVNRGIKIGEQPEVKGTTAPGVKVYLGFLSNREEEMILGNEEYQMKYAQAISQGIIDYKNSKNTPIVTRKSITPEDITITVVEGENCTLPETVNIIQRDGSKKQATVTWASSTIDTSKAGIYTCEGTLTEVTTKVYACITVLTKNNNNKYTVTIDPGHGGYDPGALGQAGSREKDVTLIVGMKMADLLAKSGVNIVYTRISDNVTWPSVEREDLRARCAISDKGKANLYLSIHCNSVGNALITGTETYYAEGSQKGRLLAEAVQKELLEATGLVNRKVKTANYYVIQNTDAASALAELGFISNSKEEQLLVSDEFTSKCAEALAKAIMDNLGK